MKRDSVIPQIKNALQQPTPDPKYQLWQSTESGQICGYYWKDIDGAWQESTLPGWWYLLRDTNGEVFVHESSIKVTR